MNTRTVDPRTIWAILAMEAGLVLPLISLPTQGDRLPGLLGPVLLAALLPLGYVLAGPLGEKFGATEVLIGGSVLALISLTSTLFVRDVRGLTRLEPARTS